MAMGSGSVSNRGASEKKERAKSSGVKKESKLQENENGVLASSGKKSNKPAEIRVVGGRIYDSVNGKSCHQCRQKTMDFVAACTNKKNNKPCTIMYCHKCLLNRYGEKAEEVSALEDWSCPKCRGICNCSICMKKRGHQPTGILYNTAKATGYSSVSEMLLKGSPHLNTEKLTADSPKKEIIALSPGKRGKENSFDGKVDLNLPMHVNKKSKKVKEAQKGNIGDNASFNIISRIPGKKLGTGETGSEKQSKKKKRDRSHEINAEKNDEELRNDASNVNADEKRPKKSRKDKFGNNDGTLARKASILKLNQVVNDEKITEKHQTVPSGDGERNGEMVIKKHQTADTNYQIPLPLGIEMNSVRGIDVCAEDVGNALQFLEFCAVFGKVLDVKKGQPEYVLQDLLHGRTGRRGKFSLTVQFHINLLSILLSEQGEECAKLSPSYGKDSWYSALKKCLSESQSIFKPQGLDSLDKAADYETLKASEKLSLLNLLCDEVLETEKVRNWMDDQNAKHAEKVKEAKQEVTAAKDQEKCLKQKLKDDIAKAVIASRGAPLSISEHEAIVSDIKQKTAQAHAKVLESKGMLLKNNQHSNVVRTEPIYVGIGGHLYWKLNCMGKADVLHQNAGKRYKPNLDDKWFIMDDEGKEAIEKLICSSR